jgi:hypothetical protein
MNRRFDILFAGCPALLSSHSSPTFAYIAGTQTALKGQRRHRCVCRDRELSSDILGPVHGSRHQFTHLGTLTHDGRMQHLLAVS